MATTSHVELSSSGSDPCNRGRDPRPYLEYIEAHLDEKWSTATVVDDSYALRGQRPSLDRALVEDVRQTLTFAHVL